MTATNRNTDFSDFHLNNRVSFADAKHRTAEIIMSQIKPQAPMHGNPPQNSSRFVQYGLRLKAISSFILWDGFVYGPF